MIELGVQYYSSHEMEEFHSYFYEDRQDYNSIHIAQVAPQSLLDQIIQIHQEDYQTIQLSYSLTIKGYNQNNYPYIYSWSKSMLVTTLCEIMHNSYSFELIVSALQGC